MWVNNKILHIKHLISQVIIRYLQAILSEKHYKQNR